MRFPLILLLYFICIPLYAENNPAGTVVPAQKKVRHIIVVQQKNKNLQVEKTIPVDGNTVRVKTPQKDVKQSIVFQSLGQLNEMMEDGVPELALSLLETEQKKRPAFTADWYPFEYKRIVIYAAMHHWSALDKRVSWLMLSTSSGKQITEKIRLWFETQQVIARLQDGQAKKALQQLRLLIWNHDADQINKSLPAVWRRLVIRAYVSLQRYEDAQVALVKYNQDFRLASAKTEWRLLQAQVLLRTGRPEQAETILASIQPNHLSSEVYALQLLAQLQASAQMVNHQQGLKRIKAVVIQVRKKLDGQGVSRSARWAFSFVAYRAAVMLKDSALQISSLENMFSLALNYPVLGKNYTVSVDALWALYKQAGLRIANNNDLLIGDDAAWQTLLKSFAVKSPQSALYLATALAFTTKNTQVQKISNAVIVKNLQQHKQGMELINQLYLHSKQIHDITVLPVEVRYHLVDYVLSQGDIAQAEKLMNSLPEPPDGKNVFDWRMRKARVLVFDGDYKRSAALLTATIKSMATIDDKSLDRYMQVVFDFQTVQQHRLALQLFDLLKPEWLTDELKREIYFWKAESYYALKRYEQAALFYLKSAHELKNEKNDLWSQSAQFKAADALVKAGIYDDAKKIYNDLLQITVSESRKSLIQQKIQHVMLLKRAQQRRHEQYRHKTENAQQNVH